MRVSPPPAVFLQLPFEFCYSKGQLPQPKPLHKTVPLCMALPGVQGTGRADPSESLWFCDLLTAPRFNPSVRPDPLIQQMQR